MYSIILEVLTAVISTILDVNLKDIQKTLNKEKSTSVPYH